MNRVLALYLDHLIKFGDLIVTDAAGRHRTWGDGTGEPVHVRFNTRASERAVAFNPGLKLGECYMNGAMDIVQGTIFDLLTLIFRNAGTKATNEPWMRALYSLRVMFRRVIQYNTPNRARRNVKHHYDLSSELYALFLDDDRQYSCAYFENPEASLDEAQLAKKRHIAAKLLMKQPDLTVLDIGCGWGGLGLYLARHCQARVAGVTLSNEQHRIANERARKAGLSERARFELLDYRNSKGPFDRIVSVGMFEHVGIHFYDDYFRQCARLLEKDEVMLLHSIGRFERPGGTNGFINKYIFPGGYIPSLSEVFPAVERAGLVTTDVEILRLHYAETLKHWRARFEARRDEAKALYDERFCRMWEFYLAASESAFRWQDLMVFQIQLAHRQEAVPLTRGYIEEAERALRQAEAGLSHDRPTRHAAE